MNKLVLQLLILIIFPTASFCVPYTQYKISDGISDIGYASILNTPVIYLNSVIQTNPILPFTSGDLVYEFKVIKLSIVSIYGDDIIDYSGYIRLSEYNNFVSDTLVAHEINDTAYFTSPDGSANLHYQQDIILDPSNYSNYGHNLLLSPLNNLPDIFGIRSLISNSNFDFPGLLFTSTPSPVPEPTTLILFCAGLVGVVFYKKKCN